MQSDLANGRDAWHMQALGIQAREAREAVLLNRPAVDRFGLSYRRARQARWRARGRAEETAAPSPTASWRRGARHGARRHGARNGAVGAGGGIPPRIEPAALQPAVVRILRSLEVH
jgi:hypothetical protein